jgi:hypothetical protein
MLRHIAFVSAALAALTGTAFAQSSFPAWAGGAIVDSVTAACNNGGQVRAKEFLKSAFRARVGVAGEPNSPGIMFQGGLSELAFFRKTGAAGGAANPNTMDGAGNCIGYVIRGNVTTIPNPNQQPSNCTFNFNVEPATITATTQTITIDGWINHWRGVTNCKVTFRAAYRLNPP